MYLFFEIMKGVFFFLTIAVGVFFLRGDILVGEMYYDVVKQVIMPGYLLFCGIMVGYIIANIWSGSDEINEERKSIFIKSFIIGIVLGLILSIIYMLIK